MFLWTLRRNEKDVVNLYKTMSPMMQIATGGSMLNFGYWDAENLKPLQAQNNLCSIIGKIAELNKSNVILDVGSGFSGPAKIWRQEYNSLKIFCLNINFHQLENSEISDDLTGLMNSTSTLLPFSNNSVDRVIALESAQHFKPIENFISESKRILKSDGLFVLAIPIVTGNSNSFSKLGLLKFTWSSEHYNLDFVRSLITKSGFKILETKLIGSHVYEPLANYYIKNRKELKKIILDKYPAYVENILYKSLLKMKTVSEDKIIDYVIIKCSL